MSFLTRLESREEGQGCRPGQNRGQLGHLATVFILVLRVALGGWFAYAGGMKLFGSGLSKFLQDVHNYRMLSDWQAKIVAFAVPWLELVAGLCLVLGWWWRGALLWLSALVVVFAVAVGSAWQRGLHITCGCFGGDQPLNYSWKFVEFGAYGLALALLWRFGSKAPRAFA